MKKIIAAVVTALIAVALVVVGVAAPASAHTATLSGSAACTTGTGAAVVTWTVDNDYNELVTIDTTDNPAIPANTTLPATGTNGGHDTIKTFTQNIDAPAAGKTVSATLTFTWSGDDFHQAATTATATVSGDCVPPTPKDASAAITDTQASCASAETVAEGAVNNASWNGPISYSGANNTSYSAVATAADGHKFADAANVTDNGKTKTFSGVLSPKVTTGCDTPPPCIPNSNVSYTYSHSDANEGVITVTDIADSTHALCNPFYVTATSWTFTNNTSVWPQNIDKVDQLGKISAPGVYSYAAPVTCGQGDIYASTDATAPSLNPAHYSVHPGQLLGSNNPFPEHFLSQMGFTQTGSTGDTWIVDNNSCWKGTPETGEPTSSAASCTPGSANSLTLPAVPGGVWTVSNTGYTHSYAIGTGASITDANIPNGFGKYTITLTDGDAHDGYNVTAAASPWSWTPVDTSGLVCTVLKPSVTDVVGDCTPDSGVSTKTVSLVFDNSQSTGQVTFTVPSENLTYVADAGVVSQPQKVTSSGTNGETFDVYATGRTDPFVITIDSFEGCQVATPLVPEVDQQTCTGATPSGGTITETADTSIVYTLVGPNGSATPTTTTPFTTLSGLAPGDYTVSAVPAYGYVFSDGVGGTTKTWSTTVNIADVTCVAHHDFGGATSDPATCSSSTSDPVEVDGYINLTASPGIQYTINDGAPVASGRFQVADGAYHVVAELTPAAKSAGDVLDDPSTWDFTLGPVFCVPTLPAWHADASATDATCTNGNDVGTITLEHLASEKGKVFYLVKNDRTGTVINAGKSATSVTVPPGVYTVTAKPVDSKDGISGNNVFDLTINAATKICGDTTTLAFTGGTIGTFGLFIAGGMLFLGLAAIYMRRKFGRAA